MDITTPTQTYRTSIDYDRLKKLEPEIVDNLYMVSPTHVDYENLDNPVTRKAPLMKVYLEFYGQDNPDYEKEIVKDFKNMGLIKLFNKSTVPINFYKVSELMDIETNNGNYRPPTEGRFILLEPSELIKTNSRNLVRNYGMKGAIAELLPEVISQSYLLKNPTRKLNVFGLTYSNTGIYVKPYNSSFIILNTSLEFWKKVTRSWYERTNEGMRWEGLSQRAIQRHIVNMVRHSSGYDYVCGFGLDEATYIDCFTTINLAIAKAFPYLRNEALRQIDEKEFMNL